jgi:hypothetical protein
MAAKMKLKGIQSKRKNERLDRLEKLYSELTDRAAWLREETN